MIKFLLSAVLLLISGSTIQAKMKMITNESMLKKLWVLKKETSYSPWHFKIVPIFLDFVNNSKVVVRGYGKQSEVEHSYFLEKDSLRIGDKMNFTIKSINSLVLVLNIGGEDYSYFSLQPKTSEPIVVNNLYKVLSVKGKWLFNGNLLEFTNEESNLSSEKSYKAVEYRNNKKYFGTYLLDIYKGNMFLILLIDGRHKEEVFQVFSFKSGYVELAEMDYDNSTITLTLAEI